MEDFLQFLLTSPASIHEMSRSVSELLTTNTLVSVLRIVSPGFGLFQEGSRGILVDCLVIVICRVCTPLKSDFCRHLIASVSRSLLSPSMVI